MLPTPTLTALQTIDVKVLELLFDALPDVAFFVKDKEGRYRAVNRSLMERHGLFDESQVIGKRPCDISSGDFGLIPSLQDERVLRTKSAIHEHLELQWHRPGHPCWCLTTKLPLFDQQGEIVGLIGFSRDLRAPINSQEIPAALANVLEHFDRHLADRMTPSSLAKLAGMSPTRFARLMKRLFEITPNQYIAKHRISAASDLL